MKKIKILSTLIISMFFTLACQRGFKITQAEESFVQGKIVNQGLDQGKASPKRTQKPSLIKSNQLSVNHTKKTVTFIAEIEKDNKTVLLELEGNLGEDYEADLFVKSQDQNASLDSDYIALFSCPMSEDNTCQTPYVELIAKDKETEFIEKNQIIYSYDKTKNQFIENHQKDEHLQKKHAANQTTAADAKSPTTDPKSNTAQSTAQLQIADEMDEHEHDLDISEGAFVGRAPKDLKNLFVDIKPIKKSDNDSKLTPKKNKSQSTNIVIDPANGLPRPTNQSQGSVSNGSLRNASSLLQKQLELGEAATFTIIRPEAKKYYGTYELIETINNVSMAINKKIPNYKLRIGNMSKLRGGVVNDSKCGSQCSVTHRNGNDVDIEYILTNEAKSNKLEPVVARGKYAHSRSHLNNQKKLNDQFLSSNFNFSGNWLLLKELYRSGKFQIAFTHDIVKIAMCSYASASGEYKGPSDKNSEAYEILRRLRPENKDHYHHLHVSIKCSDYDKNCRDSYTKIPEDTECFKYDALSKTHPSE